MQRANCIEARAKRRSEGVGLRPSTPLGLKVDVQQGDDGFDVFLTGRGVSGLAAGYTDADLEERLQTAVSCGRKNRCDERTQVLKDQLNCVSVGVKRRFAVP